MFSVWKEVEFPQIIKNISQCVYIVIAAGNCIM